MELPVVVLEETMTVYKNIEIANLQEVNEPATYEVGAVDEGQATAVEEDKREKFSGTLLRIPQLISARVRRSYPTIFCCPTQM